MTTLNQIIQQAQRGSHEAVTTLYQTYVPQIYRYIAYRVPSDEDAEDLTAEVMVKMVEGLPAYRITGAPFEAWLYRIAAARVVDFRRRARRRPQTDLSETLSAGDPSPEEHLTDRQELEQLRQALRTLSDEQQHILILRFIERKSHQEVAEIIGKTVSAVKSIQHRALTQLAAELGSETKIRHYLRGSYDG